MSNDSPSLQCVSCKPAFSLQMTPPVSGNTPEVQCSRAAGQGGCHGFFVLFLHFLAPVKVQLQAICL